MATKTKISDLRDHLFGVLEGLTDEDKPLDLDRAKAVVDVSKVIIDSAKVEVEAIKAMNDCGMVMTKPPQFFEAPLRLEGGAK